MQHGTRKRTAQCTVEKGKENNVKEQNGIELNRKEQPGDSKEDRMLQDCRGKVSEE